MKRHGVNRSFLWFNITQFFGALNDNLFKFFLVFLLIALRGDQEASNIMSISGAVFVLPFLLFLSNAGILADKVSKNRVLVWAKLFEVVAMLLGCIAFALQSEIGLYLVLFLMAAQSAMFSPSKYGIVPDLVEKEQLAKANGYIQAMTFLAIILGTILAPLIAPDDPDKYIIAALVCLLIAILGAITSFFIKDTPAAGSDKQFSFDILTDIWRTLKGVRKDSYLFAAVLASAYFLLLGAFMQINGIPYGMQELGLSEKSSVFLFLFAAFGIAVGSLFAGRVSGRNIEIGLIPLGALGLFLAAMGLAFARASILPAVTWIFVLGVSSGIFIVPVEAWIQYRSPAKLRGNVLAASSFLSWIGVLLASALLYLFSNVFNMSSRDGFYVMGLFTLLLSVATMLILPDFFVRFVALIITRFCYRLTIKGRDNLPLEGGALLVCNHVSWVDALLLSAAQQRRIRFVMLRSIYENRYFKPFFRLMGAIPISPDDPPRQLATSLRAAKNAIEEGYMVCIFAEGEFVKL